MTRLRELARTLVRTPERQLLLAALVTRLLPAWFIYGTEDVSAWQEWGWRLVNGGNPYQTRALVAWPPLWLPFVGAAYQFADATGLPFAFMAKLPSIVADVVIVFVLYAAAAEHEQRPFATAMAYAINPIAIYVSAIGGNFDAIPTLCLTLAMIAARDDRRRTAWWLGLGAAFKTWPLLMMPAIVTRMTFRQRVAVAAGSVSIFVAALLLTWPLGGWQGIVDVLLYRGSPGWWGVASIVALTGTEVTTAPYRIIFYCAMSGAALLLLAKQTDPARGVLLLLITFFVAAPTYGPQYLVWLIPVALLADRGRALAYTWVASLLTLWETLARPYTGHLGDLLRLTPHAGFAAAYGSPTDYHYTIAIRLVLWAFFIYWWLATIVTVAREQRA